MRLRLHLLVGSGAVAGTLQPALCQRLVTVPVPRVPNDWVIQNSESWILDILGMVSTVPGQNRDGHEKSLIHSLQVHVLARWTWKERDSFPATSCTDECTTSLFRATSCTDDGGLSQSNQMYPEKYQNQHCGTRTHVCPSIRPVYAWRDKGHKA